MADVTKEIALKVGLQDNTASGASAIEKNLDELRKKLLELAAAGKQNTDEFKKTEQQIVSLGKQVAALPKTAELSVDVNVDNADLKKLQDIPTGETVKVGVDVDDTEYQDFRKEVAEPLPPLPPIDLKVSPALESLEDKLKAATERMVELAAAGQQNTEEFKLLQEQAEEYKKTVESINQSVDSLAKGGSKALTGITEAAQILSAGLAIANGTVALFAEENENLQKAMLKVQGSIALLNGVQKVSNLLTQKSVITTEAAAVAQKIYAFAVGTSTGAMKTFRIALAATGIGAIVVALGFAAEAMGLFGSKTKDAKDDQKDLKNALDETVGSLEYYERKLKANGATEEDLAKLRKKRFENQRNNVQKELDDIDRINKLTNNATKDSFKVQQKALKDELDLLTTQIKEQQNIIDDAVKERADKKAADQKQQTDKATQTANELTAIQKRYTDQLAILNADALNKELLAIDQKYEADLTRLKNAGRKTVDLEAVIAKEK